MTTLSNRPKTDRIIIHCSATPPSMDVGAATIESWHTRRGFDAIGYHYVVRRSGEVEPGRPRDAIGAHARGWNHRSVGVCLIGGVEDDGTTPAPNYTPDQWRTLAVLVRALVEVYPEALVVGHRDLPRVTKACPSFDAAVWWAAVQPLVERAET